MASEPLMKPVERAYRLVGTLHRPDAISTPTGSLSQSRAMSVSFLMRINGEPVAEVDIHACALTTLLSITGTRELPAADL